MKTADALLARPELIPLTPETRHQFERTYNRASFLLRHSLCQSDLFTMPALIELAQRSSAIPNAVHFNIAAG